MRFFVVGVIYARRRIAVVPVRNTILGIVRISDGDAASIDLCCKVSVVGVRVSDGATFRVRSGQQSGETAVCKCSGL